MWVGYYEQGKGPVQGRGSLGWGMLLTIETESPRCFAHIERRQRMGGKEEKRDCQKKKKADGGGRQIGPSRMSDWSLSPDHWVGLVKDDQSAPPMLYCSISSSYSNIQKPKCFLVLWKILLFCGCTLHVPELQNVRRLQLLRCAWMMMS